MNPEADPLGKGFQALQSLIAIGTGGFSGLGIGNGRQKLFFLPEPHTDFIFSIIGEELGFIGAFALIALFAFLVWRGFRITRYSRDRFDFYAALGFTLMIGVQALINISVALCLLPTKGLRKRRPRPRLTLRRRRTHNPSSEQRQARHTKSSLPSPRRSGEKVPEGRMRGRLCQASFAARGES